MYRSLRLQLVAIVVGTVVTVLALSQWLDTNLSERALERNMADRALMSLSAVAGSWDRMQPEGLHQALAGIVQGNRDILAVDVFRRTGDAVEMAATTRDARSAPVVPGPPEARDFSASEPVVRRVLPEDGKALLRVTVPIVREGSIVGVARADVTLAAAANLQYRLRLIDGAFLCSRSS